MPLGQSKGCRRLVLALIDRQDAAPDHLGGKRSKVQRKTQNRSTKWCQ